MTVINASPQSLPQRGVVYQIYPRSFKDANNDGIGDLKGIIQQLDYLNDGTEQSLGVDAIWLSPIYKSPMADFGYDVADYCDIDPIFGDLAEFDLLIAEAHKRDIKIIMDFIPNHTSSQHQWFLESKSSRTNPKRDWYIWKDGKNDTLPPNNWMSVFDGSGWEYDETTQQYYFHSFVKEQPDLNWENPEVRKAMLNVLRFWLDRGVDGFRADAMEHIVKDQKFNDEPLNPHFIEGKQDPYLRLSHIYTKNQPGLHQIVKAFGEVLEEYPNKFMVNEVNININDLVNFYNCNNGLCIPFNFQLMFLPWNAQAYKKFIDEFDATLGNNHSPTYVLGNHDCARIATRLSPDKARLAAMLLLTLRGMPFIYYGDELGMENGIIPADKVQDPWEKRVPGMNLGRDPARTPMPWSEGKYAGFSEVEPWLPLAHHPMKVHTERQNNQSTFNLYRKLIHQRKKSPALLSGNYEPVSVEGTSILAFKRMSGDEEVLIMLNFSNETQTVSLGSQKAQILCNTHLDKEDYHEVDLGNISLRPEEGYVFKL